MTDSHDQTTDDDAESADDLSADQPAADAAPITETEPADEAATAEQSAETAADDDDSRRLTRYLEWAGLAVLSLLAVVATLRFYLSASTAIGRLVNPQYEPLFQAGFNLVVLLLAVTGISLLVRRIVIDAT